MSSPTLLTQESSFSLIPRLLCGADFFVNTTDMFAHAPTVCARLCFPTPAQEPGNEVNMDMVFMALKWSKSIITNTLSDDLTRDSNTSVSSCPMILPGTATPRYLVV